MIEITTLDGISVGVYDDFDDLFEHLVATENLKLIADDPDFRRMNWSFTIYPPRRVAAFHAYRPPSCEALREAYEEKLFVIEICTGDYKNPTYITLTPNVNLPYLKTKWCIDFCTSFNLIVREV